MGMYASHADVFLHEQEQAASCGLMDRKSSNNISVGSLPRVITDLNACMTAGVTRKMWAPLTGHTDVWFNHRWFNNERLGKNSTFMTDAEFKGLGFVCSHLTGDRSEAVSVAIGAMSLPACALFAFIAFVIPFWIATTAPLLLYGIQINRGAYIAYCTDLSRRTWYIWSVRIMILGICGVWFRTIFDWYKMYTMSRLISQLMEYVPDALLLLVGSYRCLHRWESAFVGESDSFQALRINHVDSPSNVLKGSRIILEELQLAILLNDHVSIEKLTAGSATVEDLKGMMRNASTEHQQLLPKWQVGEPARAGFSNISSES